MMQPEVILDYAITLSLILLGIALLLSAYRVVVGPTILDRTAAFDTFSVNMMGLIAVFSIQDGTKLHYDLLLMISLLPFVMSVVVAKFIVKGDIIDRDHH